MARRARKLEGKLRASVICALRREGWRVAPVSWNDASGRLC
ncbi:hypothetical protein A2U01_0095113, partial [Trifolium medium]|nr:hypothetical protein [Trifolium medium]